MTNSTSEPPPMRLGGCPYCERVVLVYEEPPRCPICACPIEDEAMRPFTVPPERVVGPLDELDER
jgi:hypothetical protein